MPDKETVIIANNIAIVQSQNSNSLATIPADVFFNFTGGIRETVQVEGFPSEAVGESPWPFIKSLFGAWAESGKEQEQLEELYRSRLIPSSMPDADE